jgi:hypothetical protein
MAHVFNTGHRIRVIISSSNYPRFEVNPNTGNPFIRNDPVTLVAHNEIISSSEYPSALNIPVTPYMSVSELSQIKPVSLDISVSPNPFNGICRIDAPSGSLISIYNTLGEIVYSKTVSLFDNGILFSPENLHQASFL